jgi:predicted phage terminase large subunit-like protein
MDAIKRVQDNFYLFLYKSFKELNPSAKFFDDDYLKLICKYLEQVESNEITRLIINMPPRMLKSTTVSCAWPAYLLGKDPTKRIICVSYSQHLSNKLSKDTKAIMESNWYKAVFPKTSLETLKENKIITSDHGFRFATSTGGSLTGEGGDIIIIDDPHNPSFINSKERRQFVIDWFEKTLVSRLNDTQKGAIVIVMQRLHVDDLSGHLTASNGNVWHVLEMPMIFYENTEYKVKNFSMKKFAGDVLSERFPMKTLIQKQKEIGLSEFVTQYQQKPNQASNATLNTSDFQFWHTLPEKFDYKIASVDGAFKVSKTSDYSVISIFGFCDSKAYLLDIVKDKLPYHELKKRIQDVYKYYDLNYVLIENKASGQALLDDLSYEGYKVQSYNPTVSKEIRFFQSTDYIKNNVYFLPGGFSNSKNNFIISELSSFPSCAHDDVVDSITQMVILNKSYFDSFETITIY